MAGFLYISPMIRKAGFFLFFLVFAACERVSDDEVDPEFTSLELNETTISPGESLLITVSGRDNEELGQVRARIREAFAKSFEFWEIAEVRDLSGNTFTTEFSFTVPDSALAGLYEVSVQIADERGNGSVDSTLQFIVHQAGEEPSIENFDTNPPLDENEVLRINAQDTLTFAGTVTDPDTLLSFDIVFRDEFGINLRSVNFPVSDTTIFDLSTAPDSVFFENFEFLPVKMELKAQDIIGHQRRVNYTIEYE
jgi:hypothetical protein